MLVHLYVSRVLGGESNSGLRGGAPVGPRRLRPHPQVPRRACPPRRTHPARRTICLPEPVVNRAGSAQSITMIFSGWVGPTGPRAVAGAGGRVPRPERLRAGPGAPGRPGRGIPEGRLPSSCSITAGRVALRSAFQTARVWSCNTGGNDGTTSCSFHATARRPARNSLPDGRCHHPSGRTGSAPAAGRTALICSPR